MHIESQDLLNRVVEWAQGHWVVLFLAAIALVAAVVLFRMVFHRRRKAPAAQTDLAVDVSVLPNAPPPPGPPVLEFYHLPVRLVAVVLAPVGRMRELPDDDALSEVIDSIVPGLDRVVAVHRPMIRRWPRQLSPRGFAHAFFQNLRLPGEHGKKTEWSAVAGMSRWGDDPIMAGLILRAETPNRHGNYVMETDDQWLGILRVRLS